MNVPKLRFDNFSDDWQNYYVGNLCKIQTGKSNTQDKVDNGKYPFYVRSAVVERSNKYIFDTEAVLTVGDGVGTGKVYHYINGKFDCHQRVYVMNKFRGINAKYFYYLFSRDFIKRVQSMTAKTSVDSVRYEMIDKMRINIPSMEEQEKIANFLTLLDRKIELQSKKIEALKLYKLCISNIYFKEQDEKNYKISDFCYIITSSSKNNYIEFGGKKFIMDMGTVDSDGNIIYSKPTNYDKDIISKGDLIMPKDDIGGGLIIGKTAYIDAENKYILGDHVFCLKCKNINSLYLHYLINSIYVNKLLRKKVTGSAQLGINSKNVLNQEIFVHEKVEQNKIADTLLLIDNNILLNKKNLEKLIFFKKGLMQKMFV